MIRMIAEYTGYRYLIQAVKNDGLESYLQHSLEIYPVMPVSPSDLPIDFVTIPR